MDLKNSNMLLACWKNTQTTLSHTAFHFLPSLWYSSIWSERDALGGAAQDKQKEPDDLHRISINKVQSNKGYQSRL
jgi:hypothetical protein